jgi:hypothetical protein
MPKRTLKTPAAITLRRKLSRRSIAALLTLVFGSGLVVALGWLGGLARDSLGPRDRYRVSFAQIECDTPPGLDRARFLSEVRYASNASESFQLLDPALSRKLSSAFAAHPWVETVESVEVEPPARVTVRLRFRTPTLAVRIASGGVRFVDGHGILLPLGDAPAGVPELVKPVPDPESASGKLWPDPDVKRAIELVKTYQPVRLEKTPAGWKLTGADGKALNVSN